MDKSTKAQKMLASVQPAVQGVATATIWKDSRVYINPVCTDRSFRGEQNHQIYVDVASGKLVNLLGKGTCRSEFNDAIKQIIALVPEQM